MKGRGCLKPHDIVRVVTLEASLTEEKQGGGLKPKLTHTFNPRVTLDGQEGWVKRRVVRDFGLLRCASRDVKSLGNCAYASL